MAKVSTSLSVPYPAARVEALWLDAARWSAFVDGFASLVSVDETWPSVGAKVVWESNPGGRGRVTETVTAHEPRDCVSTAVDDPSLTGTQTVTFAPGDEGATKISLALEYTIKRRNPLTVVVDRLFVRGPQRIALEGTLHRLALELRDTPGADR